MLKSLEFQGFKKEAITFLKELSLNNNKEWFELNRARYDTLIKDATSEFVLDMGEHLQVLVPSINYNPKVSGSLFKIYRDVRFSKNKTPMKSRIGILFWQGNSHRMQSSSFYLHFDTNEIFFAVGLRKFKTPLLKAYREYIKDEKNAKELEEILKEIKAKGYDDIEPHYKRYPKGFDKDDKYAYLSLYNGMYGSKTFDIDDVFYSQKIIDRTFKVCEDMSRLQEWVYRLTLTVKD